MLTEDGYEVVLAVGRYTVTLESARGTRREAPLHQFVGTTVAAGKAQAQLGTLEPWWSGLSEAVQIDALMKLEVVQEVLTGFRWGHPRLAMPGEPFAPFGDTDSSDLARCRAMAQQLTYERGIDRKIVRRLHDGELTKTSVAANTVHSWLRAWREDGLRGLVDKRSLRARESFDRIPAPIRRLTEQFFEGFNGDVSVLNTTTIEMKIRQLLTDQGLGDLRPPQRLFQQYLSHKQRSVGRTTRQHSSRRLRQLASSHTSYPALHPSHLALDVTRADVMVWDELDQQARSVEIITLISVATRAIVALRVTPRSSNAFEAGLVLYDAMRPMAMQVEGTEISHFRWCGVPASLDLSKVAVHRSQNRIIEPGQTLQGTHHKPAVKPSSIRSDHGSIFLSAHFMALCQSFGIDLLLSRGSKPTDNAHVERWHETLQRAYQQLPGYKGRNVAERGKDVEKTGERLLTAVELEEFLHRFVALDYHRTWHQGLVLPGAPAVRLSPLDMWDALANLTGQITVPQHPDLIYQFLPIRWLQIGHAGVEMKNLLYDDPVLKDFRDLPVGAFRSDTNQAPFHYDPRDASRIWFRHPKTDRIHEIRWKAAHQFDLPMSDWIRDRAIANVQARGGNKVLTHNSGALQIAEEIGALWDPEGRDRSTPKQRRRMYAERLRYDRAQFDHHEAALTAEAEPNAQTPPPVAAGAEDQWLDEIWPDY